MTDTPARLLKLLSLLQMRREWPGSELADRLEVSARTVRRDIDRLRGLGYPVASTMGAAGGYQLAAGAAMPPLILDDDEAVAIAVGLRTSADQAVAGIAESSVRALAKIEQVLPPRLRYRVRSLGSATDQLAGVPVAPVDPETLSALAVAINNRERLRFRYLPRDGAGTSRHVDPHRLVAAGRRWYLVAWDNDRGSWRTFRVDRISAPLSTGVRVTPRGLPSGGAAEFLKDTLYQLAPSYSAVVILQMPAERATQVLGPGSGQIVPLDAGSCELRGYADTLEWLAARLGMIGCDFTVVEPPELVDYLNDLGGRLVRAVSGL
ncbi:YafY family protein [Micrococcaceae bacterium Sec5.7]